MTEWVVLLERPVTMSESTVTMLQLSRRVCGNDMRDAATLPSFCEGRDGGAHRLLRKGARVYEIGRIEPDTWADRETGERGEKLRLVADDVNLSLTRLKGVEFEARRGEEGHKAT